MKTKDFIKLLQEEDPSGECYLRINGEPIWFLEQKQGYWDGPYNYLKKDDKGEYVWIQSTEDYKIDVHTMDLFSFAERFHGNWEEMKKHIKVNYSYLDNGKSEKEFFEHAEKECQYYNDVMKEIKEMKEK
jgi:hypothetical protein